MLRYFGNHILPLDDGNEDYIMASIRPPDCFMATPGQPNTPWVLWKQLFDNYLLASGNDKFDTDRKKALLLHCLGSEGQRIFYSLSDDAMTESTGSSNSNTTSSTAESSSGDSRPTLDSYTLAVRKLQNYFVPAINVVSERYMFRQRAQSHDETVDQYVTALRELIIHCAFGTLRDEMLRDQIVEKCVNPRIRERLLLEPNLSLRKTLEISRQVEGALRESKRMTQGVLKESARVHKVNTRTSAGAKQYHKKSSVSPSTSTSASGRKTKGQSQGSGTHCFRCGSQKHLANNANCKAKTEICRNCGLVGHFAVVCKRAQKDTVAQIQETESDDSDAGINISSIHILSVETQLNKVGKAKATLDTSRGKPRPKPITCQVEFADGIKCHMTVDTGSAVSIVPANWFDRYFIRDCLLPSSVTLTTYVKQQKIPVLGTFCTKVKFGSSKSTAEIFVVNKGTSLLGLDLIQALNLHIHSDHVQVRVVTSNSKPEVEKLEMKEPEVLKPDLPKPDVPKPSGTRPHIHDAYPKLFAPGVGKAINFIHRVKQRQDVDPVMQKLRRLPFAVRGKVTKELLRLEKADIIERIDSSEWVSPIVVVGKKSGDVRLCVDLREVNKAIVVDKYPLPDITELFTQLHGSKVFSKLDLVSAYHQLELEESSRDLTAFITHEGLFRFKRVCFGLASAPSAFQKLMSTILAGLPGVHCYLDDIVVAGKSKAEHDKHLQNALARLQEAGLRLNGDKCEFELDSINYLGHTISGKGLEPENSHVAAILEAPAPTDITTLRSALGLTNYYAKFVPNYATVVEPMRYLLRKDIPFVWGTKQQESFGKIKQLIAKCTVLALFDPNLPTIVTTDASGYGLGALLSQIKDNEEIPISFASKTLSPAERKYSTGEKEALACVWACNRWFTYLWGRKFILRTDHKSLVTLLSTRGSGRQPMRIARWAAQLLQFNYTMEHQAGKNNFVADALSRLPLPQSTEYADQEDEFVLNYITSNLLGNAEPISLTDLQAATNNDPLLQEVKKYIATGWPKSSKVLSDQIRPYYLLREELSEVQNCILRGERFVIPVRLQPLVITNAHSAHQGIVRTKLRIRELYWWPAIDKLVEQMIRDCNTCQNSDKVTKTSPAPLQPVPFPNKPWEKLGIDITGPFELAPQDCRYAIVVIDYHSKWPEIAFSRNVTSKSIIEMLKSLFAREGTPADIVTDNGSQFVSGEFESFLTNLGIKHSKSSLYYPQANGEVERFNRVLKLAFQMALLEGINWRDAALELLKAYRSTPHQTTGISPAELLHGRKMITNLNIQGAYPPNQVTLDQNQIRERVEAKQQKSKEYTDNKRKAKTPKIEVGDYVRVRKQKRGVKGQTKFGPPMKVIKRKGAATFQLHDDSTWNAFHLYPCSSHSLPEVHGEPMLHENVNDKVRRSTRETRTPEYLNDYVR